MSSKIDYQRQVAFYNTTKWPLCYATLFTGVLTCALLGSHIFDQNNYPTALLNVGYGTLSATVILGILTSVCIYREKKARLLAEIEKKIDKFIEQKAAQREVEVRNANQQLTPLSAVFSKVVPYLELRDAGSAFLVCREGRQWRQLWLQNVGRQTGATKYTEAAGLSFIHSFRSLKPRTFKSERTFSSLTTLDTHHIIITFQHFAHFKDSLEPCEAFARYLLPHAEKTKKPITDVDDINYRQFALDAFVRKGSLPVVQLLLAHDAQVDTAALPDKPMPPLLAAIECGQHAMVEMLVEKHTLPQLNASLTNVKGQKAVHLAAEKGDVASMRILRAKGVDLLLADARGYLGVHIAAENDRTKMVTYFVKELGISPNIYTKAVEKRMPLHIAAHKGHENALTTLLKMDANPLERSTGDITPLMFAIQSGRINCVAHVWNALVSRDARKRIDDRDSQGNTAVIYAAKKGDWTIAKQLKRWGADVTIANHAGEKPRSFNFFG